MVLNAFSGLCNKGEPLKSRLALNMKDA